MELTLTGSRGFLLDLPISESATPQGCPSSEIGDQDQILINFGNWPDQVNIYIYIYIYTCVYIHAENCVFLYVWYLSENVFLVLSLSLYIYIAV